MSINGVVLKHNYSKYFSSNELPFEVSSDGLELLKYKTHTSRQTLSIASNNSNSQSKLKITAQDGYLYLTTKRLVFITAKQGDVESFVLDLTLAPILQLSHKLKAPWFGVNYWEFMFYSAKEPSIVSDGFPKNEFFKGEIYFQDGGLFDFVEALNTVVNDVVNNREIDDELPAYSAAAATTM
ncbi:hypothetical protein CANMA_004825 [Candida margitis]|uniref:uncharacterized protein n=1 Tax=Candida margitis TaxID=1775924 RepID=UPI002227DE18|nr:uncharacterized protein CANMA_004825 [Candida margitis]KAI5953986.1 hypothetical protein CANMA_004825 [Candida margitis]